MAGRPLEPDPVDTGVGISGLHPEPFPYPTRTSPSPGHFALHSKGFAYDGHTVLGPIALDLSLGETVAILGVSGSGKSTLLKLAAGLLGGASRSSYAGQVAWMAQQDLLLPWLSVRDNVLLGARLRGEVPDRGRAEALLHRLGLGAWSEVRPAALSGGMRQRAALARTLMEGRSLVLMDEPFSALDPMTREAMQDLACETLADRAALLVTHDPMEACRIADRVFVLSGHPATLEAVATLPGPKPRDPLAPHLLPHLRALQARLRQVEAVQ